MKEVKHFNDFSLLQKPTPYCLRWLWRLANEVAIPLSPAYLPSLPSPNLEVFHFPNRTPDFWCPLNGTYSSLLSICIPAPSSCWPGLLLLMFLREFLKVTCQFVSSLTNGHINLHSLGCLMLYSVLTQSLNGSLVRHGCIVWYRLSFSFFF